MNKSELEAIATVLTSIKSIKTTIDGGIDVTLTMSGDEINLVARLLELKNSQSTIFVSFVADSGLI